MQASVPWCAGRDHELEVLAAAVGDLARGQGRVVVVEGAAGLGKSRLLACLDALAAGAGVPVWSGAAAPHDRDRPFAAVFSALGCAPGAADPRRREIWAMSVGRGAAPLWEHEGAVGRFAVQDALVDLVDRGLSAGPLVVAVDDGHWADRSSVATLEALGRRCGESPLLLAVARRPVPDEPELTAVLDRLAPLTVRVPLGRLDATDAAAVVAHHLPDPGAAGAVPVTALGGNPFLLVAATRLVASGDGALRADDLRGALLSRLHGLRPATVETLRLAAAMGPRVDAADLAVVRRVAELDVLAALDEACRAGVLVARGDRLEFLHELVRDAILADIDPPLRRGLHAAVWHSLRAAGRPAARCAHHVVASAEPGDLDAVAALRDAAAEVVGTDPHRAAALLGHAEELAAPLGWDDRGSIACERAEALRLASCPEAAVALVEECLAWPLPAAHLARLEFIGAGAGAYRFLGRVPDATAALRRAIGRGALDPATEAWAWALVVGSDVFSLAGTHDLAAALAAGAQAAARSGDHAAVVQVDCAASSVAWAQGRVDDALAVALGAADAAARLGNVVWPAPPLFVALAQLAAGEPLAAIATITPWGRRAERTGDLWALSRAEMVTVAALFDAGAWDEIDAHCEAILTIGVETAGANGQPLAQAIGGLVAVEHGDLDTAVARQADGHVVADGPCVDPIGLPFLAWLDAEVAAAQGDADTARAILDLTFDVVGATAPIALAWLTLPVVRRAAVAGDRDRLGAVADLAAASLTGGGRPALVVAAAAAAAAGDPDALDHLAAGGTAAALPLLRRDLEATAAALRADRGAGAGPRLVPPGESPSRTRRVERPSFGPDSLTPAELAVLALVADGLPNAEIGERLHLSKRTVESHVSRMYTKLGIRTRVELALVGVERRVAPPGVG